MRILLSTLSIFLFFCFLVPSWSLAQQSPPEEQYEEVVFGFTLKELGNYNISVAVKKDRVYLPVMELFNIFEVYFTIEGQNNIRGTYLSSAFPMTIDPVQRLIIIGKKRYELREDEIFAGGMDVYLSTEKFEEIFGITSTVNMNRLQISAETARELPALVRMRTALEHSAIGNVNLLPKKYPLLFGRKRSALDGAVLDYNVTTFLNSSSSQGTMYTFTGGGEVAGGDVQGSLVGATGQSVSLSDARWRYVVLGNKYFSSLTAGQVRTGSDFVPRVTGIALSNEPVEPRVMFDNYVVDGYTEPESDVELYLNDRLVDFQKTNAAGYYRFQFPLTYGTMRIAVKTFSKYGDINVNEKQVQIPFTFVPKGVLSYNLNAGRTDDRAALSKDVYFGNANLLFGAANWLTLKGGVERNRSSGLERPLINGGFSSRLFSQYVINVDAAPEAYYRADASALFASNAGVFVQYANYLLTDTLIGTSPQQNASLALSLPLTFISYGTGFRVSEDYTDAASGKRLSTRLDLSTRIAGAQLLVGYRGLTSGADVRSFDFVNNGLCAATATYALPRGSFLPEFLQGFLLRGGATYGLHDRTFQDASLLVSKTFMRAFQFNLGFAHNFAGSTTAVQAGLIMDLNFTRASSVIDASNGNIVSRHSFYGSAAVDHNSSMPFLTNREQIGKGGVDVVLFVDADNNGVYNAGEELISAKGVKVDGMGKIEVEWNGVIRVSQLQSYYRYNLEVDRQQIDPNLVPTTDKFSFIVDPNQFKRIEIPFYRGGTVSGTVYLENEGVRTPLSGTRVIMRSTYGPSSNDTLRTFMDGGFYVMNVAPGSYTLTIDPTQLQFIQAVQRNGPLSVTVHRSQEGDIIDTLEIALVKQASKGNLKPEDDLQKIISRQTDAEAKRAAEKQRADSLENEAKRAAEKQRADSLQKESKRAAEKQRADSLEKEVKAAETAPTAVKIRRSPLVLNGVMFESGKGQLTPASCAVLDQVAKSLKEWTEVTLEVQGHTDSSETDPDLSLLRADIVRNYLIENGIAAERMMTRGYGSTRPIGSNTTAIGRSMNRRVEFHRINMDPFAFTPVKPLPKIDLKPDYDSDKDGVPDSIDKCPLSAGPAANNGCPETAPTAVGIKRSPLVLNGVMFESGKAQITPTSCDILDYVAKSLQEWTEVALEIQGHADSREIDPDLSQQRADMVRDYLIRKGVAAERMTARGYGSTRPIGDNEMAVGRSKNRRVELHRITIDARKVGSVKPLPKIDLKPDYDSDKDGISDQLDRCPNDPEDRDGFEDTDGCPDYDNDADGVPDSVDKCPLSAGPAANKGCPETETTPTAVKTKRSPLVLNGVMFESGKAQITPTSCDILDYVAKSLREWTEVALEIQGHADSREIDPDLSQQRADMVRDYLIRKGVAAERMTARGYGSTRPIGSNDTAIGRSKNRRVELHRTR